jgi:hypothetical protein
VLEDENRWDLTDRGKKSTATRTKKLRFMEDRVITLLDWAAGDGRGSSTYSCGTPVRDFKLDGRHYRLLLLERFYNRGDELDFCIRRRGEDRFPNTTERVRVEAAHIISVLKMTVRWPADRPPKAVRLRKTTAAGRFSTTTVSGAVTDTPDGRREYTTTITDPELGGETAIEWDW